MSTVLVQYRPNPDIYDEDVGFFNADYFFDLTKLEDFATMDDVDGCTHIYSQDEAQAILRAVKNGHDVESHDKYSFFDTSWERDYVLNKEATYDHYDHVVTVYLNS